MKPYAEADADAERKEDDDTTEATAELSPDNVVLLGGREIAAAQADGVWVEVEPADGYGWVESHLLEGFEAL